MPYPIFFDVLTSLILILGLQQLKLIEREEITTVCQNEKHVILGTSMGRIYLLSSDTLTLSHPEYVDSSKRNSDRDSRCIYSMVALPNNCLALSFPFETVIYDLGKKQILRNQKRTESYRLIGLAENVLLEVDSKSNLIGYDIESLKQKFIISLDSKLNAKTPGDKTEDNHLDADCLHYDSISKKLIISYNGASCAIVDFTKSPKVLRFPSSTKETNRGDCCFICKSFLYEFLNAQEKACEIERTDLTEKRYKKSTQLECNGFPDCFAGSEKGFFAGVFYNEGAPAESHDILVIYDNNFAKKGCAPIDIWWPLRILFLTGDRLLIVSSDGVSVFWVRNFLIEKSKIIFLPWTLPSKYVLPEGAASPR